MGKPWGYIDQFGVKHLMPEEAKRCKEFRARSKKTWDAHCEKCRLEKEREKNDEQS